MEIDLVNGRLLFAQGIFGVFAPVIGGGDNDALGEGFPAGGGEEAVDIGFAHAIVGCVTFALDGVVFLGATGACDEVNAGVLGGDAELGSANFPGPIPKKPDVAVEVGIAGLITKVSADELFEVGAFFPLGLGSAAVLARMFWSGVIWYRQICHFLTETGFGLLNLGHCGQKGRNLNTPAHGGTVKNRPQSINLVIVTVGLLALTGRLRGLTCRKWDGGGWEGVFF